MHQPEQGAAKQSPTSEAPKTSQPLMCLVPDSVIKVNQAQSNTGAPGNSLPALGTEQPGQAQAGEGEGWGRVGLTPSPHLHPFPYFEALDTDNSCSLTFRDANH